MYKIYINDHLLELRSRDDASDDNGTRIILPYMGGRNQLLNVIDKYEKSKSSPNIVLQGEDPKRLFGDFKKLFKNIKAAGGVVVNDEGLVLFIYRFDCWDLPKGKRDKGEKNKETAIREVQEETGLEVEIVSKLGVTHHTYHLKGRRVLKKTVWYKMRPLSTNLVLQSEESIEAATWRNPAEFLDNEANTYASILDVISWLKAGADKR
ncbi:MAG: NUDIX domain-containing protein [Saprospiraceae bacterium]|nr:NUDIX domain-containing protein [Saprospiraceae bacterium]